MPTSGAPKQDEFFFAWVDEGASTFSSDFERMDEVIFGFVLKHDEGQFATLDLTIKNPRVGLLNPDRKVWAWFTFIDHDLNVRPLFFGILTGIPSDLFAEVITIQLQARPADYNDRKQAVAETMKTRPQYDPVFLSDKSRDDPDAILEGWSALWHCDRVSHEVSASDILTGEDGVLEFDENGPLYSSVKMALGEAPLAAVQVRAQVTWTQRAAGLVDWPLLSLVDTAGDFAGAWPKPGTGIGGGWSVGESLVNAPTSSQNIITVQQSGSWNWHQGAFPSGPRPNCGPESVNWSYSGPPTFYIAGALCVVTQDAEVPGICDPYTVPNGLNVPASQNRAGYFLLNAGAGAGSSFNLTLRYDAKRQFTEQIVFEMALNAQSVLTSPATSLSTEQISVTGADVGQPLIEVDAWSDYRGQYVAAGTIIFPNDPTYNGGTSYQACVGPGTAGMTPPNFSDTPGALTTDGGVTWASLGASFPTDTTGWESGQDVAVGQIICFIPTYRPEQFNVWTQSFEPSVTEFTYYLCTSPGATTTTFTDLSFVDPTTNHIVTIQYIQEPAYTTTPGATVSDGTVEWTCLGQTPVLMGIPIGATPQNCTARNYFPSDRGLRSVEYLIMKARAALRMRARCVKIGFDCPMHLVADISCRWSAKINDSRIPGGSATGKVTSYSMSMQGGSMLGHVEIGCSVGYGGHIAPNAGQTHYVQGGYVSGGYQQATGVTTVLGMGDVGYSPPLASAFDDSLSFPLTFDQVNAGQHITVGEATTVTAGVGTGTLDPPPNNNVTPSWVTNSAAAALGGGSTAVKTTSAEYIAFIRPVTNGPFNGAYNATVTALEAPQGIDLTASEVSGGP
jgi:hypothetical protein